VKKMSLWDHLDELRSRLILCALFFGVCLAAALTFQNHLMRIVLLPHTAVASKVKSPLQDALLKAAKEQQKQNPALAEALKSLAENFKPTKLIAIKYPESFLAYFRVCLIAALIATIPFLVFQLWRFVAAGLYQHERRVARFFVPLGLILFFAGLAFGYFLLVPVALRFLLTYGSPDVVVALSIGAYLDFFNTIMLALGLCFQLPLGMMLVAAAGIAQASEMAHYRRHIVVAVFVVAAALTPPDVITQFLLAIPLIGLYEFGLVLARFMGRKDESDTDRSAASGQDDTV